MAISLLAGLVTSFTELYHIKLILKAFLKLITVVHAFGTIKYNDFLGLETILHLGLYSESQASQIQSKTVSK